MLLAESTRLLSLKVVLDTKCSVLHIPVKGYINKELISRVTLPIDTHNTEYWRVKVIILGKLNAEAKFQPRLCTLSCQSSDFS